MLERNVEMISIHNLSLTVSAGKVYHSFVTFKHTCSNSPSMALDMSFWFIFHFRTDFKPRSSSNGNNPVILNPDFKFSCVSDFSKIESSQGPNSSLFSVAPDNSIFRFCTADFQDALSEWKNYTSIGYKMWILLGGRPNKI